MANIPVTPSQGQKQGCSLQQPPSHPIPRKQTPFLFLPPKRYQLSDF